MSREVLRDAIIYLPAKVVPAFVGVLTIPVLTRLLTPEQYGQYLLAMASLTLTAAFCISWLVSITIRFNVVFGVYTLFRYSKHLVTFSIMLACVIWVTISQFLNAEIDKELLVLAGLLWLVSYGAYEYFSGWLRARNFATAYGIAVSWRSIAGLLLAVFTVAIWSDGAKGVLFGYAGAMLLGLILLPNKALQADNYDLHRPLIGSEFRTILRYGLPAALANLVTVALSLADRYVINSQLGPESVAVYGASYDIAEKTVFFANSMLLLSSSVVGFRIFEKEGEAKAAYFLSRLMRLYLLAAPPLVLVLAILSRDLVMLLLPDQYHSGAEILPIVAFSGLFIGIMHRYSLLLSFHKRTDIIMWCSLAALVINLISCNLLVPKHGLLGAALSTAIAYVGWLMLVRLAALKYIGPRFPWNTLYRVICALIISAVVMVSLLQTAVLDGFFAISICLIIGMTSYTLSLFLLGEIKRDEIKSAAFAFKNRINKV